MYVVLTGTISVPFAGVVVNAVPLHIVLVLFATTGVGFTVTVTVKLDPTQLPASPLVVLLCIQLFAECLLYWLRFD